MTDDAVKKPIAYVTPEWAQEQYEREGRTADEITENEGYWEGIHDALMRSVADDDAHRGALRIGSLFSGYGGLDIGVIAALGGGSVAWHVEFDAAPSKILAHHWPDAPNYGDVRTVDWATVEPVDVLTGGFPCQDVSLAGARAGLKEGTRSGLWSEFAKAIDVLRPQMVVIENVRGLLSATAGETKEWTDEEVGDLESGTWALGEPGGGNRPVLRAIGAVLGNLAELGYDAEWCGVRASDAGAPHGRFRIFILAHPRSIRLNGRPSVQRNGRNEGIRGEAVDHVGNGDSPRPAANAGGQAGRIGTGLRAVGTAAVGRGRPDDASIQDTPSDADGERRGEGWTESARREGRFAAVVGGTAHRPPGDATADADHGDRLGWERQTRRDTVERVTSSGRRQAVCGCDWGAHDPEHCYRATVHGAVPARVWARGNPQAARAAAQSLNYWDRRADSASHASGERRERWGDDGDVAGSPRTSEGPQNQRERDGDAADHRGATDWGDYKPAIERWQRVTSRVAPPPTKGDAKNHAQRLNAVFVEWMMGLALGHVTDPAIGLTRNQQLKALGNGVVPQQAQLAVSYLLARIGWVLAA